MGMKTSEKRSLYAERSSRSPQVKSLVVCGIFLGLWVGLNPSLAANPYALSYGGRLVSVFGEAVKGPVDLELKFYREASGGDPLPVTPIIKKGVSLTDGVFQVDLPELSLAEYHLIFSSASPTWIGVFDRTNNTGYPRQRFTAVPYAFKVPVDEQSIVFDTDGRLGLGSVSINKVSGLEEALRQKADAGKPVGVADVSGLSSALSSLSTQIANKQNTINQTSDVTVGSLVAFKQSALELRPYGAGAGQTGEIRFFELAASGQHYGGFKAPDGMNASVIWTLPPADGANQQVLSTNGEGALSWISGTSPVGTAGGDLTGSYPNPSLKATGVTAGTYPRVTVNEGGQVTQGYSTIGSTEIEDGAISNADISSSAEIDYSKILVPNGAISGDKISGGMVTNFASKGIDDNAMATAITVTPGQNVGIGTTAPTGILEVNLGWRGKVGFGGSVDDFSFDGGSDGIFYINNNGVATGRTSLTYKGNEKFTVTNSGNVGIGTSAPNYLLHVNGSIAAVGTLTNLSDRRFKKDIVDLENSLEKVLHIRGVSYRWIDEKSYGSQRQLGVIAQEIEKVVPEVVDTDADGIKRVRYSDLIVVLIEAFKTERSAKEKEIRSLKDKINTLAEDLARSKEETAREIKALKDQWELMQSQNN